MAVAGVELVGGQLAAGLQVDADVDRSERPPERRQRFAASATPLNGRCDKHLSYVQHPPCAKRSPARITSLRRCQPDKHRAPPTYLKR